MTTYEAAADRYDDATGMEYRFTGRSGLKLPVAVARPVAELRRRPARGDPARDPAPRVRPRRHPLRPGQQLRPAVRPRRGELRALPRRRLQALPRRADHLDQGRLRHVARALRPGRRLAQVRPRLARPVAGADGPGVRRHLLQPPLRPGDAGRGDDDGARPRGPAGQGAVRRHLVVLRREDPRGGLDRPRPRHAAADPPAVVLACSTAGSRRTCSTSSSSRAWAASCSRPLAQGLLTDRYLDGDPRRTRARRARARPSRATTSTRRRSRHVRRLNEIAAGPRPEAGPAGAAVGAPRPAGDLGGDRRVVGRAARHQPRRPRRAARSPTRSSRPSTRTPSRPASTSGRSRPRSNRSDTARNRSASCCVCAVWRPRWQAPRGHGWTERRRTSTSGSRRAAPVCCGSPTC